MLDQSVSVRAATVPPGDGTGARPNWKALSADEMMRNYEYLVGRVRDIEIKLRIIIDGLQFR